MKKKLFAFSAVIICIFALSVAFSACEVLFGTPHTHSYVETVVAPTCTEQGYTLHECGCGESFMDGYKEPLGHSPKHYDYTAPTCTEEGYTAGTRCEVCGEVFDDCEVIAKIPHTEESFDKISPTCTKEGVAAGVRCSVCGEVLRGGETLKKLDHTPEVIAGKAATCTEDGTTDGSKCSECGVLLEPCQTVPAKGHKYTAWEFEREITCTSDGLRVSVCPDCGHRTEETIAAFGHRAREGKTASQSDCVICNTGIFVPRTGNSSYGYYDLYYTSHGVAKQNLYYKIYLACEALHESESDLEEMTAVMGEDEEKLVYYAAAEIDLTGSGLDFEEVRTVWQVFYVENPAYFWMLNNMLVINKISSDDESSQELVIMVDSEFATYERRAAAQASIDKMTVELNAYLGAGLNQTQKAVKIHDFLAERMEYAYKSDGTTPETEHWAHNMMGAAENKKGVCEAYAKTYLYFCLYSGVNCIVVTGYAGSDHAWNYIEIDGSWYGVDVTWDDAGKNVTHTYLGANESRMNGEHTPYLSDDYYYNLPELSKTALDLNK